MRHAIILAVMALSIVDGMARQPMSALNFHGFFKANQAEAKLDAKEYDQALALYDELAADAADPEIAALAAARAAVALGLQENKYEQGLERAKAVADRAYGVHAQIELMFAAQAFQEIVDSFGAEDIAAWPDRTLPQLPRIGRQDVRALALFDRGRSYLNIGDKQSAVRDLEQAQALALNDRQKFTILSFLSRDVYARALDDPQKVFETDKRIAELSLGHMAGYLGHVLAAARYLREQERWDEALEVLSNANWMSFPPGSGWLHSGVDAIGQTLAGAGRFDAAAANYRQIAENRRFPAERRAVAGLKAAEMLAAAGDKNAARQMYQSVIALDDLKDEHRQRAESALADLAQP